MVVHGFGWLLDLMTQLDPIGLLLTALDCQVFSPFPVWFLLALDETSGHSRVGAHLRLVFEVGVLVLFTS